MIYFNWPPGPFLATQYDKEPGGAGFEATWWSWCRYSVVVIWRVWKRKEMASHPTQLRVKLVCTQCRGPHATTATTIFNTFFFHQGSQQTQPDARMLWKFIMTKIISFFSLTEDETQRLKEDGYLSRPDNLVPALKQALFIFLSTL